MRLDNQDRSGIEKAAIEGTDDLCLRHLEGLGVAAEVAVLNAITVVPRYREDRSFPGDRLRGDVPTVVSTSAGPGAHDWGGRSMVVGRR